jgi:aspartate carbamoyltransferase catalytic subunit
MPMAWDKKHLISLQDFSRDDFLTFFQSTPAALPKLKKTIALLFFEPSTRTRASFFFAARQMGLGVFFLSENESSLKKGESVEDTVKVMAAMGADIIVLRCKENGLPKKLTRELAVPIVNAGDGTHEHPTQALQDLYTVWKKMRSLEGKTLCLPGDILHGRVAGSLLIAARALGMNVLLCGPEELCPERKDFFCTTSIEQAVKQADILYLLRMQTERGALNHIASLTAYKACFQLGYVLNLVW